MDENETVTWCVCGMMDIWKELNEAQSYNKKIKFFKRYMK